MEDKRYLFRGFHPNEKGKTVITLNGKKIRGEWMYWNHKGQICNSATFIPQLYITGKYRSICCVKIFDETVGQFTGFTDKNGKYIFVGDIVSTDGESVVVIFEDGCFYPMGGYVARSGFEYDENDYEVIGNRWEVQE